MQDLLCATLSSVHDNLEPILKAGGGRLPLKSFPVACRCRCRLVGPQLGPGATDVPAPVNAVTEMTKISKLNLERRLHASDAC